MREQRAQGAALDGTRASDLWHHPSLVNVDALLGQLPGLIKAIDNAHRHFHWLPLLVGEVQHVLRQAVDAEVTLLHFEAEVGKSVESNLIES